MLDYRDIIDTLYLLHRHELKGKSLELVVDMWKRYRKVEDVHPQGGAGEALWNLYRQRVLKQKVKHWRISDYSGKTEYDQTGKLR
jgi:hypothetical protein